MTKNKNIFLNGLIDLAQSRLGSKIIYKTDEFFAPARRIINPWPPVFKEGVFDKNGKWMDGWETRRKRGKGHDYLILKLGRPGKIYKVDIDTSYFSGNQPSKVVYDLLRPITTALLRLCPNYFSNSDSHIPPWPRTNPHSSWVTVNCS